eukprot:m.7209 g.7209  ORF g.7209 m.7209 type:complete len:99 (+) comp3667_c0_seq2:66-362(+)
MATPSHPNLDANGEYISQFAPEVRAETTRERMRRKIVGTPLVPAFLVLTVGSLVGGLLAFKNGNQMLSQKFQRARVFFQFSTVAAFLAGSYLDDKGKS